MNHSATIAFDHVTFHYHDGSRLFSDLCLELESGGFYLIKGPSGTGKSTLLRLMNRLEEPSKGQLLFQGNPFLTFPAPELRRLVLYIQQTPVVTDGSVKANLLMPFSFKNNRHLPLPDDARLRSLLDEFSLDKIPLDKQARALSVGQQQRLCLIRGLLLSPSVILLDEPTSALDDESSRIVENMAESLYRDQGKTIVMVSHREFRPINVTPIILNVEDGRITILPH